MSSPLRLVLRALRCHPADPRLHLACTFDRGGGLVGRDPSCALSLCPQDRHVSREHLRLRADPQGFVLSVVSRVNGVEVDARHLPPGGSVALAGGECLGLGGYLFLVEVESSGVVGGVGGAAGPATGADAPGDVDVDVDANGDGDGDGDGDGAACIGGLAGPDIDELFAALDDWLPSPSPSPSPSPPPLASPSASLPASPTASPGAATHALTPFANALGLALTDLDPQRPAETLALAGALLRRSLEGLHRLLDTRGRLRRDLRLADRTLVATRDNNPMKHAGSAREALRHLLDLRQHGSALFMPPERAVGEAVDDLVAHQAALVAGLRGTLEATLRAFSPDELERRIRRAGALDGVLPALHKARLWDRFAALHAELAREAGESFERVTIEAFAQGYARASRAGETRRAR